MTRLRTLNVSGTKISNLPMLPSSLETLNIANCKEMKKCNIKYLSDLKELIAYSNKLKIIFPSNILSLSISWSELDKRILLKHFTIEKLAD